MYFPRQEQRIIILIGIALLLGTTLLAAKRLHPEWFVRLSMGKPDFIVSAIENPPAAAPEVPDSHTAAEPAPIEGNFAEGQKVAAVSEKININTADKDQLQTLPGIGETLSLRIIDYRNKHGSFKDVNELTKVKRIGNATLENIRELITVGDQKHLGRANIQSP